MRTTSRQLLAHTLAFAVAVSTAAPAFAAKKAPQKQITDIPICQKVIGVAAVVEPDTQWWRELELGSPEALIKYYINKSKCFKLVDRSKGLAARSIERAMADSGEMRKGSQMGKGQVKAADFFIVPDLVGSNRNSGGTNIGAAVGGLLGGGLLGGLVGGISLKKKEANVLLTVVDARSTEQVAMAEGHSKKTDLGWGGGGGLFGGFGGIAGASSYANTEIGQVISLAYLDAYYNMVVELGGNPIVPDTSASDEAPGKSSTSSSSKSSKSNNATAAPTAATTSSSAMAGGTSAAMSSFKVTQGVNMFKTPSEKSGVIRPLPIGAIVKATGKKNGLFWEVQDRSGQTGWVAADYLDDAK
jgi:curli biogenesis system outer membrane secretion channel CsgG